MGIMCPKKVLWGLKLSDSMDEIGPEPHHRDKSPPEGAGWGEGWISGFSPYMWGKRIVQGINHWETMPQYLVVNMGDCDLGVP